MAYGFEKLSHDPSSLTDLTLGLVVLCGGSIQAQADWLRGIYSKKVIKVVEDMIAINIAIAE